MPRFLYFVPGARTHLEAQAALHHAGLGDVLQGECQHSAEVSEGPGGGKSGLLMVNHEGSGMPGLLYRPETQTWTECGYDDAGTTIHEGHEETPRILTGVSSAETRVHEGVRAGRGPAPTTERIGGRFWIGYTKGDPPGPADLARPSMLPGWKVRLADGRDWEVPVALAAPWRQSVFPKTMKLKAGGDVERDVQGRYRALDEYACEVYDTLTDEGTFSQDETIAIPWASRALSMNYYAGEWELGAALGCFDTETLRDALFALIDWPTMELYAQVLAGKKNVAPDFYRRFAGFGANFGATRPATPTSSFTD